MSDALKPQTQLREYVILRVLGSGAYGITYLATDTKNDRSVAIKEYFPERFAKRSPEGFVNASQPAPDDVEDFDSGLSKFLEEAATLAGFSDDNIVEVLDWFEHNGTAYVVMRYEEGRTLARYLRERSELIPESEILGIFIPLLKGLRTVHAKWFLHRDIKPENIYIRKKDDHPLLIDFGTARHAATTKHRGMTAYLTPGFAPPEQYDRRGDHGPWTDIYALGATMYFCVTRIVPYDGGDRYLSVIKSGSDPVIHATQAAPAMYSKELLEVIDWMMAPDYSQRPASVDDVLARLTVLPAYGGSIEAKRPASSTPPPAPPEPAVAAPKPPASPPEPPPSSPEPPAASPEPPPQTPPSPPPEPPPTKIMPRAPEPPAEEPARTRVVEPSPEPAIGTGGDAGAGAPGTPAKQPLLMYGAIAALVVLLVGGGLLLWLSEEPQQPGDEPVRTAETGTEPAKEAEQPAEGEAASEAKPEQPAESEPSAGQEPEKPAEPEAAPTQESEQPEPEPEPEPEQPEQPEQPKVAEEEPQPGEQQEAQVAEPSGEEPTQAEKEQARLNEMLAKCDQRLAAGPVTGPSGERALACYRGVLEERPANQTALDGISRIEKGYVDAVRIALDAGAHAQARLYVNKLDQLELAQGRLAGLQAMVERRTPGEIIEDKLEDGGLAPAMVVIPAGAYTMGCGEAAACTDAQRPAHTVQVDRSFLISRFEVTFEDYDRFAEATGRQLPDDRGWGRGQRPVINVSWNDAQAYVQWLRDQTGQPYRLPNEAEWEYVARAGSDDEYFFGDDESQLCNYANHADADSRLSWHNTQCSDGFGDQTAPVGRYAFNDWEVFDLLGNVWEWTADCWHEDYEQAPGAADAWLTRANGDCERRVIRGGSWYDDPAMLRPRVRNWAATTEKNDVLGFRIAADVE